SYSITRTWTATDACGNTSTAQQTITVEDNTTPIISGVGANLTLNCGPVVFSQPTVADNCDPNPTLTFVTDTLSNSGANCYSVQRIWTATDACGNVTTAQQTITIEDNVAPVIAGVGQNQTIACPATPVFSTPTATDNCASPALTFNDVTISGNCPQSYSITRTWTASDACGNSVTASQTITVEDNIAPVLIGCSADTTICEGLPLVIALPTATDNCAGSVTVTSTRSDGLLLGDLFPVGTTTVTFTATDGCNVATCTTNVTVLPTPDAPQLLIPSAQIDCINPTAQLCITNPDPAYLYIWINGTTVIDTATCITVNEAGSFFVFALNAVSGCASQVIGSNNNVTLDTTVVAANCTALSNVSVNGGNNGSLEVCITSGSAPFTISLGGQNIVLNAIGCHTFTNLTAGSYTATITGANGCVATTTCGITQPNCEGFRTQTQGGWGQCQQNGNNPGSYLANNFAAAFPAGLSVGCNNTLLLTSSTAVCTFLPSGSTPSALPIGNLVNPGQSYHNVLAGQVVALTLNVGFDNYDANFGSSTTNLGDLIINSGTFVGWTVNQLLAEANNVLGGCPSAYTPSQINAAVSAINENYVDGNVTGNFLNCPPPAPQLPAQTSIVFNNYPNPFSQYSTIEFRLPETEVVVVEVYNYAGAMVAQLYNATVQKNVVTRVNFESKELSNGIYIYKIITPSQSVHGKMILLK
ncbi:MAG: T9SS type A sorting domain-containing protein, partial [Nitrosopumilus sp.]|nr:T9SS type A sorting domain-containing protein [Nitrosopumilus sp.]